MPILHATTWDITIRLTGFLEEYEPPRRYWAAAKLQARTAAALACEHVPEKEAVGGGSVVVSLSRMG